MLEAAILRGCVDHGAKGVDQFTARAIVQCQCEHRASIVRCALARPGHALLHIFRQFVLPPDILQTNIVLIQCRDFRLQIAAQQAHQEIDFALGTLLPVFFREGVERYSVNAGARRRLHRRTDGRNPGAMPGHARHMAPFRPAPVAVHDDGDVFWEPPWIKLPVDFRFFPIQPRGYFVLQSDPLRIEANTGGKWVAMREGVLPTWGYRASSGTIFNSSFSVCRSTVSAQLAPARTSVSTRWRSSTPATGLPSSATITSPSRRPARFAGLFSATDKTSAPDSFARS